MSSRSKTDLVVRVRYQNKLPPPPFPPRLLHIPTTPQRYASYESLNALSSERELPMILDGELGMPLELGKINKDNNNGFGDGEYWSGNRSGVVPTGPAATPHEDDLYLLGDVSAPTNSSNPTSSVSAPVATPLGGRNNAIGERRKVDVSWLRRTEYLSSDPGNKVLTGNGILNKSLKSTESLDSVDRAARAAAIASSFASAHVPLSELRHPTKPQLRAEESWDVLPDASLWANRLNFIRFGEDPGERDREGLHGDPRLPRALFRPIELINGENRVGYYLPISDQVANEYTKVRQEFAGIEPRFDEQNEPQEGRTGFEFRHVRDYEITTTRTLAGEYVFVFHDGTKEEPDDGGEIVTTSGTKESEKKDERPRGAYFAPVHMAQVVRKRRPRRGEDPTEFPHDPSKSQEEQIVFWDGINVQLGSVDLMPEQERTEREEELKKVLQPPQRIA